MVFNCLRSNSHTEIFTICDIGYVTILEAYLAVVMNHISDQQQKFISPNLTIEMS